MLPRMLAATRIVPLHAQPVACRALDAAYIADSAQVAVERPALADSRCIHGFEGPLGRVHESRLIVNYAVVAVVS